MKDVQYASINGVELHDLRELDCNDDILFAGDIWLDDKKVGSFSEVLDEDMKFDVEADYVPVLQARVNDYLEAVAEEGEELPRDIFFMDLIEMERYLQMYREGLTEGYACLLVNYTEEGVDIFSVETEEEIEAIVRENNFEDFQVFSELEHFVISC